MDIDNVLKVVAEELHYSQYARKALFENYKDFSGDVVDSFPKGVDEVFRDLSRLNAERVQFLDFAPSVSAAIIVKKSGKRIRTFYGRNRMPSDSELLLIRKYYGLFTSSVHAELDAVIKFMKWYLWKEPKKSKRYELDFVVVRGTGNLPSRPCAGCRRVIGDLLSMHNVILYYPLGAGYFAVENFTPL